MSKPYTKAHYWQIFFCFFFFWSISGVLNADIIAVFYALEADLKTLQAEAQNVVRPVNIGSRKLFHMVLNEHEIIAVQMGSGCVETAMSAQALLTTYRCDLAISIGPAGSLDSSVETGKWFAVEKVSFWQKGTETSDGFHANETSAIVLPRDSTVLAASPDPAWRGKTVALTSGEAFIASQSARDRLHLSTGASLVDMNSYGLAAACADHQVPLYILRIVSDGADEAAGETFRTFVFSYDGEGGRLAARFISHLPPNPEAPENYEQIRRLME